MAKNKDIAAIPTESSSPVLIQGNNYLLAIGIDDYEHCDKLHNAVLDVQAFVTLMQEKYGFGDTKNATVTTLLNADATADKIIAALEHLAENVGENDHCIIYFSGHGTYKKLYEEGFWVPIDAKPDKTTHHLPNVLVKKILDHIKSRHTFLIVDACFSGTMFHEHKTKDIIALETNPSRYGLSSGRAELVSDGNPGEHSFFAKTLLDILRDNNKPIDVASLCAQVVPIVASNSKQTPRGEVLNVKGHQGGSFYLRPTDAEAMAWKAALERNTVAGFTDFLEKYPDTKHREKALQLQADAAWENAKLRHTETVYDKFTEDYPRDPRVPEAEQYMRELAEDKKWKNARERDSLIEYKAYLRAYPTGKHVDAANTAIERIKARDHAESIPVTPAPTPPASTILTPALITPPTPQIIIPNDFVLVQGGSFMMGSENGESYEKPVHRVTLRDFYMCKYQVTVQDFQAFVEATNYKTEAETGDGSYIWDGTKWTKIKDAHWRSGVKGTLRPTSEYNHPVIHISWNDAVAYCTWRSKQEKLTYRLPSEAEWEYAARGGQRGLTDAFEYAGSNNIDDVAWYYGNSKQNTHAVGGLAPNQLGIYDLSGNVWEWCEDQWHGDYKGAPADGTAWVGQDIGTPRVLRGGGSFDGPQGCRAASRNGDRPGDRSYGFGFRLVLQSVG
jgi:formylglycine-generating enzyme required for sulfatase activity